MSAKTPQSKSELIRKLLKKGTMTHADIRHKVVEAGYNSCYDSEIKRNEDKMKREEAEAKKAEKAKAKAAVKGEKKVKTA